MTTISLASIQQAVQLSTDALIITQVLTPPSASPKLQATAGAYNLDLFNAQNEKLYETVQQLEEILTPLNNLLGVA